MGGGLLNRGKIIFHVRGGREEGWEEMRSPEGPKQEGQGRLGKWPGRDGQGRASKGRAEMDGVVLDT